MVTGSNAGGKGSVQLEPRKSTLALPLDHRSLGPIFKGGFPRGYRADLCDLIGGPYKCPKITG